MQGINFLERGDLNGNSPSLKPSAHQCSLYTAAISTNKLHNNTQHQLSNSNGKKNIKTMSIESVYWTRTFSRGLSGGGLLNETACWDQISPLCNSCSSFELTLGTCTVLGQSSTHKSLGAVTGYAMFMSFFVVCIWFLVSKRIAWMYASIVTLASIALASILQAEIVSKRPVGACMKGRLFWISDLRKWVGFFYPLLIVLFCRGDVFMQRPAMRVRTNRCTLQTVRYVECPADIALFRTRF